MSFMALNKWRTVERDSGGTLSNDYTIEKYQQKELTISEILQMQ